MTTVLLIDDHELIRQGLAGAFAQADGFEVAGQAASVEDGLALARDVSPDVVVTDVRLPDGSGLDVVRALRKENKLVGLVVLTMYAGDEQLFAAMDAGASGFVGKDAPTSTVIGAARQASDRPAHVHLHGPRRGNDPAPARLEGFWVVCCSSGPKNGPSRRSCRISFSERRRFWRFRCRFATGCSAGPTGTER